MLCRFLPYYIYRSSNTTRTCNGMHRCQDLPNDICCYWDRLFSDNKDCYVKSNFVASLQCFRQVRLQPACSAKAYPIYRFQIENLTVFILSADKIMMQRTQYRCMVFNQIGLKPVCSAKNIYIDLVFFFSDKEATVRMVSHNKEAGQSVKTQNFPAGKTFTGIPINTNI